MRNPLDSLSSDRAFRTTGSLLCGLVNQPSTRGFDDPVLVGFGSIAVPLTVSETLNHFGAIGAASASLVGVSLSLSPALFLSLDFFTFSLSSIDPRVRFLFCTYVPITIIFLIINQPIS